MSGWTTAVVHPSFTDQCPPIVDCQPLSLGIDHRLVELCALGGPRATRLLTRCISGVVANMHRCGSISQKKTTARDLHVPLKCFNIHQKSNEQTFQLERLHSLQSANKTMSTMRNPLNKKIVAQTRKRKVIEESLIFRYFQLRAKLEQNHQSFTSFN